MSPPISKEWWVAAALTGAAATPAFGQQQLASIDRKQIGVVTSMVPGAAGQPGRMQSAPLVSDGTRDQRIVNDTDRPMHVMFADQSAMTIGPKSAVTLKDFNYNADTKSGNIAVELTKGVLRMVGGLITKKNPAVITTQTATIGIRGGIGIISAEDTDTTAAFLYGDAMEVTPLRRQQPRAEGQATLASLGEPLPDSAFGDGAGQGAPGGPPVVITVPGTGVNIGFTGALTTFRVDTNLLTRLTVALGAVLKPAPAAPGAPPRPVVVPPAIVRETLLGLGITPAAAAALAAQSTVTISVRQATGGTTTTASGGTK